MKNLLLIDKYVFMTPWCPGNNQELYRVSMYLSANVSTFLITALEMGNLFCDKYRYMALK